LYKKRLLAILVIIVGSFLIIGLSRNIIRLLRAEKKVDTAHEEVRQLQSEQEALLEKKEHFESEEFIEEQARDKLQMTKEGEAIVVLPSDFKEKANSGDEKIAYELPNWQQWLQVFRW